MVCSVKKSFNMFYAASIYICNGATAELNDMNGNRTELSPIQSVIIRVINKIGLPRRGSLIC